MGTGDRRPSFPARVHQVKGRVALSSVVSRWVKLSPGFSGEVGGLCPFHMERTPSFTINDRKGFYHCFGCGAHGDVVDFVAAYLGIPPVEALDLLERDHGLDGVSAPVPAAVPPPTDVEAERARARDWARAMWDQAQPGQGTLADAYLRSRAIALDPWPWALRFLPRAQHKTKSGVKTWWPAMIAAVQDIEGRVIGVHRTFLAPDGRGKAPVDRPKMMLGDHMGGAIRLAPAGARLGIGEGIESAASVMVSCRRTGNPLPVWAAGSLGNIAGGGSRDAPVRAHPLNPDCRLPTDVPDMARPGVLLPADVRSVVVLADADAKDQAANRQQIRRAAARWREEGREVRVAWPDPGMDFNDMLMAAEAATAARRAVEAGQG